jgi:hypothetical protein
MSDTPRTPLYLYTLGLNLICPLVETLLADNGSSCGGAVQLDSSHGHKRMLCLEHLRQYDVGFNPFTQRHYRRLIYYLYIHSFLSYDHHQAEKYITTLGLLN